MDYSSPGSSVHGIFQARILEWVAISYSKQSSQPRDRTCVSCISFAAGEFCTTEPLQKPIATMQDVISLLQQREASGTWHMGFPRGAVVKNPPANAGHGGSIPGLGRSPEGNGNPLQYSSLGNPMDRRAWQTIVHGITKELDTT